MPAYYDENKKTWYCKFYYTDWQGQRKQKLKRGFKLQREAKEWERLFLEKLQGTPDMTFQALYELYMEDVRHRLREGTANDKKSLFENRILPYFKNKPINAITPADIRQWQNVQIGKGYSDAYLDRMQGNLSTLFNYAVRFYDLPANPCRKAGHMGKCTRSMKFWTLEQFNQVISYVKDPAAYTALLVLFYSGMRTGELLALTLADLDFTACTININKAIRHIAGKGDTITPPKTENSIRTIIIPGSVMQQLQDYCNRIYGLSPSDRIFPFTRKLIRGNMERGAKAAGVPFIRIHDLRHSHVSMLIDLGFSTYLIAERIGDTVQMVNNTYGHLYPTKHQEVADRLDQLMK